MVTRRKLVAMGEFLTGVASSKAIIRAATISDPMTMATMAEKPKRTEFLKKSVTRILGNHFKIRLKRRQKRTNYPKG